VDALAAAARRAGVGITLLSDRPTQPEEHRSYGRILTQATEAAAYLAEAGVGPGDRVVLCLTTSFDFIVSFFAVQWLGAIPVPAAPPSPVERLSTTTERLRHICHSADATVAVVDSTRTPAFDDLLRDTVLQHVTDGRRLLRRHETPAVRAGSAPGASAMIQYSSGSTERSRGILLSQRSVCANVQAIGRAIDIRESDRVVSWLPLHHDMGLIGGLLTPVYWQLPLVLMSPVAFLSNPLRWLRAMQSHGGSISSAPSFAYALCARRAQRPRTSLDGLDLSGWRVALNGSEPVDVGVIENFVRVFEPHGFSRRAMLPVYGLAEATLAVTFPPVGFGPRWEAVDRVRLGEGHATPTDVTNPRSVRVASVGLPLPGSDVRVVDEQGRELPERRIGHVVVTGPSVMDGYYAQVERTREVLEDGRLRTGDLGYLSGGELFITGRDKDIVIVHGRNYFAEDLERLAQLVDGVQPNRVVAFAVPDDQEGTESIVMMCETRVRDGAKARALVEAISTTVGDRSGLRVDRVVLVGSGTIRKTSSGKPQRRLTRAEFLNGRISGRLYQRTRGTFRGPDLPPDL